MCPLNERLRQLALEAKQYPLGSAARRKVVDRLFKEIQDSGEIRYPKSKYSSLSGLLYQECCNVVFQKVCTYIYRKIQNYRPDKEVLAWFNYLIEKRFIDAEKELRGKHFGDFQPLNLHDLADNSNADFCSEEPTPYDALDLHYLRLTERDRIERFIQEIREDSTRLLQGKHIQSRPELNLQYICLKLHEGYSFTEIATEHKIANSTIGGFWKKNKHLLEDFFES